MIALGQCYLLLYWVNITVLYWGNVIYYCIGAMLFIIALGQCYLLLYWGNIIVLLYWGQDYCIIALG